MLCFWEAVQSRGCFPDSSRAAPSHTFLEASDTENGGPKVLWAVGMIGTEDVRLLSAAVAGFGKQSQINIYTFPFQ